MAKVKIEIRHKDRLIRKLEKIVPGLRQQLDKDLRTGALEIESAVKSFAPVDTGDYRNSLNVKPVTEFHLKNSKGLVTKTFQEVRAWGLFAYHWWPIVEFGTHNRAASPHIFGPYRLLKRRIKSRIARGFSKMVKAEIARKGSSSRGR
ncbi:MAG: HK97 gp10 family phage protein [Pseudomonadota bacterium]